MKAHQLEFKFYEGGLLEEICEESTLRNAFKHVKKNKGAPGIDGITIIEFEQNLIEELAQLKQEVLGWKYKPTPVKRVLRLIGMILRSGIMSEGTITILHEGSVQGSPLSPLLSNLVLDELDKELEERNLEFCRYADDCNIFVKTERAAIRVMGSIKKFIETKLKLQVNEEKSKVAKSDRIKFLGMTIVNGFIAISKKTINKAMDTVKTLIPRGTHQPINKAIEQINIWYKGWASYFKMTQYPAQLAAIEAHIRRRLRARFVKQQKRRRNLYHKLIKQGVGKKLTAKTVYSNKGVWNLSHTRAVEKAFSNEWFEKMGLKIVSNLELNGWLPIDKWVKLV